MLRNNESLNSSEPSGLQRPIPCQSRADSFYLGTVQKYHLRYKPQKTPSLPRSCLSPLIAYRLIHLGSGKSKVQMGKQNLFCLGRKSVFIIKITELDQYVLAGTHVGVDLKSAEQVDKYTAAQEMYNDMGQPFHNSRFNFLTRSPEAAPTPC